MQVLRPRVRLERPKEQARQVQPRAQVQLLAVRQEVSDQAHARLAHADAHRRKGETTFARMPIFLPPNLKISHGTYKNSR